MKKILKVAVAPLMLSALLVGCSDDEGSKEYNNKDEIAKVGDVSITQGELTAYLMNTYGAPGANKLIEKKLIELEAKSYKIDVSKKEIDKAYNAYVEENGGKEAMKSYMESYGITEDVIRADFEHYLLTKKTAEKYLELKEKDAKAYFEENKEKYDTKEQVDTSHILVEDEDTAKAVIDKLNASKEVATTFAKLAGEYSSDSSATNGGKLGYITAGDMIAEFETAAFALEVGTYTKQPVKSSYGYHVIYVADHKQAKQAVYEEIKETVYEDFLEAKINEIYATWLEELEEKYKVKNKLTPEK